MQLTIIGKANWYGFLMHMLVLCSVWMPCRQAHWNYVHGEDRIMWQEKTNYAAHFVIVLLHYFVKFTHCNTV